MPPANEVDSGPLCRIFEVALSFIPNSSQMSISKETDTDAAAELVYVLLYSFKRVCMSDVNHSLQDRSLKAVTLRPNRFSETLALKLEGPE